MEVAEQEYVVEVRDPWLLEEPVPAVERAPAPAKPVAQVKPTAPKSSPKPADKAPAVFESGDTESTEETAEISQEEFMADLEAIMSGDKAYDPVAKKVKSKGDLNKPDPARAQSTPAPAANPHQIFDLIRDNLQLANAYDLGTVELDERFSQFDQNADQAARAAKVKASLPRPVVAAAATTDEFIQDLDLMQTERAVAKSVNPAKISKPFYDTGEHVRAGGDLYEDRFRVGKNPGVNFSYGQLIAMADVFEKVEDMMAADPSELQRLKTLIERSTRYYKGKKADPSLNVGNDAWDEATGGRYLKLATNNYEHFAPNLLFKDAPFAKAANRFGNNRTAWETHHERAIREAQQLFLSDTNRTSFPEWPLTINAFGDHFLTDAFSAGHVINKEVTIASFKRNFFSGDSLSSEGKAFFKMVASMAFRGEVAQRFSSLETTDYPACAWGWCFRWHPNIDSVDRFATLLTKAAEQEPERVADFAVKALHDRLNQDGVEVFNEAGDGTWTLTGDGTQDEKNLVIMQKAVQQSVDNINDPSLYADNVDLTPYFIRVWRHVPQLTEASRQKVIQLTQEYTSPSSNTLATAAAAIISREVNSLINVLLQEGKLQRA
jgi:hypothetical protein